MDSKDKGSHLLNSPIWIASFLIVFSIVCALTAASYLFGLIQDDVKARIQTTLEASINRALQDQRSIQRSTIYWSESLTVRQIAQILDAGGNRALQPDLLSRLDISLTSILETENYRDYKIFNKDGQILLSGREGLTTEPLSYNLPAGALHSAWNGKHIITKPFKGGQRWRDIHGHVLEHAHTMLFLSPVVDWYGETVAIFAFEIDPDRLFIPAFHHSQIGETGQSYGIDSDGLILTETKFNDDLVQAGILERSNPHADLNLKATDPGVQLIRAQGEQLTSIENPPLNIMAKQLINKQAGINIKGYRDYRGVDVVGAWRWVDELNMGVVTETEVDEVYKLYRSILYSVVISILFVLIAASFAAVFYKRFNAQRMATLQQRDAIINQTDDGFVTIDEHGTIQMVNPAISQLYGYSADELINQPVSLLMPPTERQQHDVYLAESELHAPRIIHQTRTLQGYRKDGSVFPIELNVTPMHFGDKRYFIGVIRDISETYKHQQEIITAMREAEKANRAKSEFLAKMSHELRTPLNAIIGFSQLLLQEELNEGQRESVELISSSGSHLLSLINDVLDLSRIESGNMRLSVEGVDVKALIEHLIPLIQVQLAPLSLKLRTHYPAHIALLFVEADYLKLKQIILNLLSNATKYNRPNGEVDIMVTQRPNNTIRIAIKDSGYGIDKALQDQLFQPFNRLDKENSTIQGTGIGLAISHELAKLMGGHLDFTSSKGQGSTFWIDLQQASTSFETETDADTELNNQSHQSITSNIIDVLCIEDNPTNMQLIEQFAARQSHYRLFTAENGRNGLDMAIEHDPDVVLLDINLPDMQGFEVIRQLRQSAVTRHLKIIVISANARKQDIEKGYEAGCDRYLTKPINFNQLSRAIEELTTHIS